MERFRSKALVAAPTVALLWGRPKFALMLEIMKKVEISYLEYCMRLQGGCQDLLPENITTLIYKKIGTGCRCLRQRSTHR
jgi:hypothetical protein